MLIKTNAIYVYTFVRLLSEKRCRTCRLHHSLPFKPKKNMQDISSLKVKKAITDLYL